MSQNAYEVIAVYLVLPYIAKFGLFCLLTDAVATVQSKNQKPGIISDTGKVELRINLRIQVEMRSILSGTLY